MQWLIANMWIAMAAATVLGLLFGFALRGLLVGNRVQKAEVEREIAKTELTQSKAEIEALYAAQRKQKGQFVEPSEDLVVALEDRERQVASLSEELAAARGELERLEADQEQRGNALETAGVAVAGAVAGAVLSDGDQDELVQLRDRNAWLEERVGALETDIAAQTEAVAADEAPTGMAQITEPVTEPVPSPADEKMRWQSSYLRMRVNALETKLIAQSAIAAQADVVDLNEADATPEPAPEAPDRSDLDEELAQLRWRNRYLEGRLAYFEQAPEEETEAADIAEDDADELQDEVDEAAIDTPESSESEPVETETDSKTESGSETELTEASPTPEGEPESVSEEDIPAVAAVADEPEIHPSEAMLAELDGKQPLQIDRPSNGGDDLTTITGIGPRIAEVLNGLGIWTFAQIAEWQPPHETWIENHLSFKGRVSRENWVGQAKELLVAA